MYWHSRSNLIVILNYGKCRLTEEGDMFKILMINHIFLITVFVFDITILVIADNHCVNVVLMSYWIFDCHFLMNSNFEYHLWLKPISLFFTLLFVMDIGMIGTLHIKEFTKKI